METAIPLQHVLEVHDQEIILAYPIEQIVLNMEEIPSLDVFYSPSHKIVVKRRKRRRIDGSISNLMDESVDVLWKYPLANPTE